MKVYWLSSCSFFQSWVLYALTHFRGLLRRVALLEACSAASDIEEASSTVLPITVIFLSAIEAIGRFGSLKGGLRRPILETIIFWLEVGILRYSAISSERSEMVSWASKENV